MFIFNQIDAISNASYSRPTKSITTINQTYILDSIEYISLKDGRLFPNYTKDTSFLSRLKAMSYAEAENLNQQIIMHADEFPMPHMAITAGKINKFIQSIPKDELTPEETKIFNQLQNEISQLSPFYPYKKSLIFSYKFLVCKSFIDYKREYQLKTTGNTIAHKLFDFQNFHSDCTLTAIYYLPWHKLITDTPALISELYKICDCLNLSQLKAYFSLNINHLNDELKTISLSNNALIPYTQELTIEDFNKIWNFSLALMGYSLATITNADGHDMLSNSFFDHDLTHVIEQKLHNNYQNLQYIFTWVKNIYNNKQLLSSVSEVSFEAIELAIFFAVHELPGGCCNYCIRDTLLLIINMEPFIVIGDLSAKYKGLSVKNVIQAAKFLTNLPEKDFTDTEFTQSINKLITNIANLKLDALESPTRKLLKKKLTEDQPDKLKQLAIDNINRPIDQPIDNVIDDYFILCLFAELFADLN